MTSDQRTQIPQRLVQKWMMLQFLLDYSSIMLAAENARNHSSLVLTPTLHALDRPFPLFAAVTQHDS